MAGQMFFKRPDGALVPVNPGPKGGDGRDGTDGAAGRIASVSATTLPPGSQATATNTGTPEAAQLVIGVPQGDKGDTGRDGDITQRMADLRYERRGGLLSEAVWHVDAGELTDAGNGLADLTGNGRDAVFGASAAAPVVLPWDGEDYVYIPSQVVASNRITSPVIDMSAASAFRIRFRYEGNPGGSLFVQTAGTHRLAVDRGTNGSLSVSYHNGSGWINTAPTPLVPSGTFVIGETYDCVFAYDANGITATVNGGAPFSGAWATPGYIPSSGGASIYGDSIFEAEFAGGAVILDPSNVNADYTKIANTGTAGGDWTIVRAASGFKTTVVDRPLLLFGGAQHAKAASRFPDTPDLTMIVLTRQFGTAPLNSMIIDTALGTGAGNGVGIAQRTTDQWIHRVQAVGSNTISSFFTEIDGQTMCAQRVTRDGAWKGWRLDGSVSFTASGSLPTWKGVHDNPVMLGGQAHMTFGQATFELIAAAVFDRALTDAEVAKATQELLGTPHTEQPDPHPQYILKSLLTSKGDLAVHNGTAVARLPVGGEGQSLTVSGGAPSWQASRVGNLLTPNQASGGRTSGTAAGIWQVSATAGTPFFDASKQAVGSTSTAAGPNLLGVGHTAEFNAVPVTPGQVYTATITLARSNGGASEGQIIYRTNAGSTVQAYYPQNQSSPAGQWVTVTHTSTAPPGATLMQVRAGVIADAGETVWVDRLGIWQGAGGDWAMPGEPILNQGRRVTRPNGTDRLVEVWDGTAWAVVHYDSGIRDVSGMLVNGWTVSQARLHRVNANVQLWFTFAANGKEVLMLTLPVGFRHATNGTHGYPGTDTNGSPLSTPKNFSTAWDGTCRLPVSGAVSVNVSAGWLTDETAIPSSLPGTPIGTAP